MTFPFISLVIPCYNESARIGLLFDGIAEFAQQWPGRFECILVDDGSTDQTALLIQAHPFFLAHQEDIKLLQQANTGKGGALQNGVLAARGEHVLTLDADMAARPVELLNWLEKRRQFYPREILIGSRELQQSKVADLGYRKLVGNIFNILIRLITGLKIQDTQCGFKLYGREAAHALFGALQTKGWAHDVEILKRANRQGLAIVEMPLTWRAIEGSKIRVLSDSWTMFWDVVRIARLNL